jgi:hypothetical protein
MDTALLVIAALTALAAGVTGAWSPCGFSMVDTLGSAAPIRGRRVTLIACATFTLGALAGGVATFGSLALVGDALHRGDSTAALVVAVAVAGSAAIAEAAGLRIAPQIRRQVPEGWRHTMPLPIVGALYGILLGLGFTTFVLTFAVWALAGVSIALGSPAVGVAIGVGFGLGRAIPVVVMAPRLETSGERLLTAMAERPRLLGGLRRVDAALLALLALAISAGAASASPVPLSGAAVDPAVDGDTVMWRSADGAMLVRGPAGETRITGSATAAAAGPYLVSEGEVAGGRGIAVDLRDGLPAVLDRGTPVAAMDPAPLSYRLEPGVTAIAASGPWVVWRRNRPAGGDELVAARLPGLSDARIVAATAGVAQISRPSLDGAALVFAINRPTRSQVQLFNLETLERRVLRTTRTLVQYRDPSIRGDRLLSVVAGHCEQALRLEPLIGASRGVTLLRFGTTALRDRGHVAGRTPVGSYASRCPAVSPKRTQEVLDATAISAGEAFVTVSRPGSPGIAGARILRMPLPAPPDPVQAAARRTTSRR